MYGNYYMREKAPFPLNEVPHREDLRAPGPQEIFCGLSGYQCRLPNACPFPDPFDNTREICAMIVIYGHERFECPKG